ncbi:MAG: hypothetical protein ACRDYX_20555 [Egibacteraceae bacterium]
MMVDIPIDGAVLGRLRRDHGWSQDRLATQGQAFARSAGESTGVSTVTICRMKKEEHLPTNATLDGRRQGVALVARLLRGQDEGAARPGLKAARPRP